MIPSAIWSTISSNVRGGTTIRNWTAAKGNVGEDFDVKEVTDSYVVVTVPGAQGEQRIPRADFEAVDGVWPQYCAGSIQRQQLRETTRFSKYIISIVHHLAT